MADMQTTGPPNRAPSGTWRYDATSDAYYWWDGQRYTATAKQEGAGWAYGKIRSAANRRTTAALWWSIAALFLWFAVIPLLMAIYYLWDATRKRMPGESLNATFGVAIGLVVFDVLTLGYGFLYFATAP